MPLTSNALANELKRMVPVASELDAVDNFALAWENYFKDATVLGIPVTNGSLAGAISTLKIALVGWSQIGAAASKIQAGITAFWVVISSSASTIWATAPPPTGAIPPPGLSGISPALSAVFLTNISSLATLDVAAANIANVLHPTQLGGICLIPPPPAGPGPQPIL